MPKPEDIRKDTVDALLQILWRLFEDEGGRESSLNLRGVATAGFGGVIIGLSTSLAKEALQPDLPTAWRWISLCLFVAIVIVLVGVVAYTLMRVLLPRDRPMLGVEEVERYTSWAAITRPVEIEQGRAMNGLVTSLTEVRSRNNAKALALRRAYIALTVGLGLVSALALIIGLRYAGVIELEQHLGKP